MLDTKLNKKRWLIISALCVLTLIGYWQVKDHSFVNYDDDVYVTNNPQIQSGLHRSNLVWAFQSLYAANWHPLTWLSHMLDYQFYGLNPSGHHLTNLFIHLVSVGLLFWVLHFMTRALWRSALVAALFAIHPLNVESVAWIAERKNVLSTLFWMLTIWAYAWYASHPGWKRYVLVVVAFILGLMSKPMLVTLPFVLLLLDYWPLGRFIKQADLAAPANEKSRRSKNPDKHAKPSFSTRNAWPLILEKAPLLLLSAAASVVTVIAQREGRAVASMQSFPLGIRLENAVASYADYLYQTLWPSGLGVFYLHPMTWLPVWQIALAGVVLLGITALAIWGAKRFPYLGVGWLWYVGTLVPVIGLVQVGLQSRADRYAYVPLIGIFILLAWGINEIAQKFYPRKNWLAGAAAIVLLVLLLLTRQQVSYWRDSATLFGRAVEVTENNYIAENNLGEAFALQGKFEEAKKQFSASLEINPDYASAQNNLGMTLVREGKLDEAIAHLSKAVELNPQFYEAYNRLGAVLLQKERFGEAAEKINQALAINPTFSSAYANLGILFEKQGKLDDALEAYGKALQFSLINSLSAQMHYKIGFLLEKKGEAQKAVPHYREALRLKPDYSQAQQSLTQLLGKLGQK
jgi:protein O-mannosyl-transferase